MEFIEDANYSKFALLIDALNAQKTTPISKDEVVSLLGIAQSDREQELVRYSIFKAFRLSYTAARKKYGFQDMKDRETRIKTSLAEAKHICEVIDDLASTENTALLSSKALLSSFPIVL